MSNQNRQFDISIDHTMLNGAKNAFDLCLKRAIAKAIATGSDEGSATLKIGFEIRTIIDDDAGEVRRMPLLKYKAGFSVPMKESVDGVIEDRSTLVERNGDWQLIRGQISMDELLNGEEETE